MAKKLFKPTAKKVNELKTEISIFRNLTKKKYQFEGFTFGDSKFDDYFCFQLVKSMPYILYFDDFRDSIDEKIEILKDENGNYHGWLEIIETLFEKTDSNFSVFKLKSMEARARKSVLAQVKKKLNETLTYEWRNFKLEEKENLSISLEFVEETDSENRKREYLKFEVIESDSENNERFFFIRDRSKGFYWFFNFVMKLEFNPKENWNSRYNAIYLLDEPGSYLHASAQEKLCKKLVSLSESNKVIYCTHSHYLLNPEIIPLGNIRISDKDSNKSIKLKTYFDYKDKSPSTNLAFQPLYDALHLKPFTLDLNFETIVLTEGVTDFFLFSIFNFDRKRTFMPCVGADSIKQFISILMAWQKRFFVFWDFDDEGKRVFEVCRDYFGDELSNSAFRFYSLPGKQKKKVVLEHLIETQDFALIKKELNLPENTKEKKVIANLFYSKKKEAIVKKLSTVTKENIEFNISKLV
ncbi:ATP-dependent nuclease [Leptospira kmetyi]|uniref:ATP-dependent nuclease n=1 Tax=Leptospira kmetyi TaxID=408139 RepID=UPI003EBFD984